MRNKRINTDQTDNQLALTPLYRCRRNTLVIEITLVRDDAHKHRFSKPPESARMRI